MDINKKVRSHRRSTVKVEERQVWREGHRGRRLIYDLKKREEFFEFTSDEEEKKREHAKNPNAHKHKTRDISILTMKEYNKDAAGNKIMLNDETKQTSEPGSSEYDSVSSASSSDREDTVAIRARPPAASPPPQVVLMEQQVVAAPRPIHPNRHHPSPSEEKIVDAALANYRSHLKHVTNQTRVERENEMVAMLVRHRRDLKRVCPLRAKAEHDTVAAAIEERKNNLKCIPPREFKAVRNVIALAIAKHRNNLNVAPLLVIKTRTTPKPKPVVLREVVKVVHQRQPKPPPPNIIVVDDHHDRDAEIRHEEMLREEQRRVEHELEEERLRAEKRKIEIEEEAAADLQKQKLEIERLELAESARLEKELADVEMETQVRMEKRKLDLEAEQAMEETRNDFVDRRRHMFESGASSEHHGKQRLLEIPQREMSVSQRAKLFNVATTGGGQKVVGGACQLPTPKRMDRHGYQPAKMAGHEYGKIKPASHFQPEAVRHKKK